VSAPIALGSALLGLKFFEELPTRDAAGEPITGGRTPLDLDEVNGVERLVKMAAAALAECAGPDAARARPAPLLVCLPDAGGGLFSPEGVLRLLCEQAGPAIDRGSSRAFASGRAAMFDALEEADRMLSGRDVREVYVGGVDSLVDREPLDVLLRAGRIRTSTTEGMVPGEGAVFLRLRRGVGRETRGVIVGLARGHEQADQVDHPAHPAHPNIGTALSQAARAALAAASLSASDVGGFVHDASGERPGFREAAMAITRLRPRAEPPVQVWTPASSTGELGAATGPFALALAAQFLHKGVTAGPAALVLGTSDGSARSAAVVTGVPAQPQPPGRG
jgi:3-oxoacyl-[acyl-carrier-protein] synthase-1